MSIKGLAESDKTSDEIDDIDSLKELIEIEKRKREEGEDEIDDEEEEEEDDEEESIAEDVDEEQSETNIEPLLDSERDKTDDINIEDLIDSEKDETITSDDNNTTEIKEEKMPKHQEVILGKYYDIDNRRNKGVLELDKITEEKVKLDLTKPQIHVICGKIGSGKTYSAGVIIEEYLKNNRDMALIVIDIMGIYYSLKFPNTSREGLDIWGDISPYGFKDQVEVLVPEGDLDKYAKGTYDNTIALKPNQLKFDAWLDLFQIQRTDPQGIVFEQVLRRLVVQEQVTDFSIDDLIHTLDTLEQEAQLTNTSTFHKASATSVRGKLIAMQSWGIFSQEKGLSIRDVVKKGKCIVIDISNSARSVGALLCSFLADRIYEERSKLASQASHKKIGIKVEQKTEYIPPVALFLEEAHNYLPAKSGGQKFNIKALRRYVKQGRSPGLSLYLVTQEPGDLDTKALKQLQGIIIGLLSHRDDFKNLKDISPFPIEGKWEALIRTLSPGQAIIAFTDQEKLRVAQIRRKHSIHVARTETVTDGDSDTEVLDIPPIKLEDIPKLAKLNEIEKNIGKWKEKYETLQEEFQEFKNRKYEEQIDNLIIKNKTLEEELTKKKEQIKVLSNDIKKLGPKVPKVNSGIILGKFDETLGYTAEYVKDNNKSNLDSSLIKKIVKTGMGMGETNGIYTFSIPDYEGKIWGERFEINNENLRGGNNIYSLILFTNQDVEIENAVFEPTIKLLIENINDHKILNDLYNSFFEQSSQSDINTQSLILEIENRDEKIEDISIKNKHLAEKIGVLEKERNVLQSIKEKYEQQINEVNLSNADTQLLKKTIEAKDTELEVQSRTVIDLSNKNKQYKKLVELQDQRIKELEKEIVSSDTKADTDKQSDIEQQKEEISDTDNKEEIKDLDVNIEIVSEESESEKDKQSEEDKFAVIEQIRLQKKFINFDEAFYVQRIAPVTRRIIKKINKIKNKDDICFSILSIIEGKADTVTTDELSELITNVTVETIRHHINKHLHKKKMIRIYKTGRRNYYGSNMVNFIKQELKKDLNLDVLTQDDIIQIYYKVRDVLDLSVGFRL